MISYVFRMNFNKNWLLHMAFNRTFLKKGNCVQNNTLYIELENLTLINLFLVCMRADFTQIISALRSKTKLTKRINFIFDLELMSRSEGTENIADVLKVDKKKRVHKT